MEKPDKKVRFALYVNQSALDLVDENFEKDNCLSNALIGDSKFTEEALSLAIDTAKAKIENNVSLIEEKRYQLNHKEADIQKMDYYYQQFVSWADEFDNASAERKRMILCTLFKEITIGKGYKIELLMDNSYEQFIA